MKKILKIGGIVLGVFVLLFVIITVFLNASKNMLSSSTSFGEADVAGLPSQGMTFSSPASSSVNSLRSAEKSSPSYVSSSPNVSPDSTSQTLNSSQTDKKIIKNGSLSLKVDSADKAAEKISEISKNNDGEVFSSNFYQSGSNAKSGTISVKVPVANFEKSFSEIKSVASLVIRESTSGQDVTEQYVDLQAQLKNRQAEEQSFVKILDQAQKIQDVLDVTQQISRVRGEIERLEGKIKYLDSQTDMSTISVTLTEDQNITVVDSWRPLQVVKESFNSLLKGLQGFVDFLIKFVIVIIPYLLVWALFLWIIYIIGKKIYIKIKNRRQDSQQ